MRILVTGGAGFIASHVVDRYVALGHEVAVADDLSRGSRDNVNPKATFHRVDIRDAAALEKVFERERPEVVNHHAAQVDVRRSLESPAHDASVNVIGSVNLLELCAARGVRRVIYASSGGAVYGNPRRVPVDEEHPVNPVSPYGVSKHVVEHYLYLYGCNRGLEWVALRYANVYGPRQDPSGGAGVVVIFAERMFRDERPVIFGDGSAERDYVYVDDVARANVLALERGEGLVNIGSGVGTSVTGVFEAVRNAVGWSGEPEFQPARTGEVDRIYLSAERAAEVLGWRPEVSFAEGVAGTVEWVKKGSSAGR